MNRGKSKKIVLAILGGTLLIIILVFTLFEIISSGPLKIRSVEEKPMNFSFSLPDLKGEMVDISPFRGKVVLLNFWATWCPPCRQEIPDLNELYRYYKKDGLVVVGISMDRGDPNEVQKFLTKNKVEYLNLMENETPVGGFAKDPGLGPVQAIPTTFLIDRQGQIYRRFIGFTERKVFEGAIKKLL